MILIAGLGNPGAQYAGTRHNIGFMILDHLADHLNLTFTDDLKVKASTCSFISGQSKIILAKPLTFMNNSGVAIANLSSYYKIPPANIWIIFDEIDLPLGKIRILKSGGPGTHNGMKSIVDHIGKDFPRFRIGIDTRGITAPERQSTSSFVLENFLPPEHNALDSIIDITSKSAIAGLEHGLDYAMNHYNQSHHELTP